MKLKKINTERPKTIPTDQLPTYEDILKQSYEAAKKNRSPKKKLSTLYNLLFG